MISIFDGIENKVYIIEKISDDFLLKKRIMELGFLNGTKIKIIKISPKKNVFLIEIRGYILALRKSVACAIWVKNE